MVSSLENTLLSGDHTTVKIIDFGQARLLSFADDERTQESPFRGSKLAQPGKPIYRAPEVRRGYDFFGTEVDAFALGVLLFVMIVRMPPFDIADPALDGRYKLISEGRLAELLIHWGIPDLQPDLIDLMGSLMALPRHRLKVFQIMNHPWMNESTSNK